MPDPRELRVARALHPASAGAVLEAVDDAGVRWLVWPATGPAPALPAHPGLPEAGPTGRIGAEAVRLERVPRGAPLPDVAVSDGARELARAAARVALEALHAVGIAHGEPTLTRIWVGVDGEVMLVGAAVEGGGQAADRACVGAWPDGPAPAAVDAARAELAAAAEAVSLPPGERRIRVEPEPVAAVDEVGVDIGPDEVRGLLDGWTATTGSTGERTGALDGDPDIAHARMAALLGAVAALESADPRRHPERAQPPPAGRRAPPLLLPLPDGLQPPPLVPVEAPAEVTAIRFNPFAGVHLGDRPTDAGVDPQERTQMRIRPPGLREPPGEVTAVEVTRPLAPRRVPVTLLVLGVVLLVGLGVVAGVLLGLR